jgi:hypothetical protein
MSYLLLGRQYIVAVLTTDTINVAFRTRDFSMASIAVIVLETIGDFEFICDGRLVRRKTVPVRGRISYLLRRDWIPLTRMHFRGCKSTLLLDIEILGSLPSWWHFSGCTDGGRIYKHMIWSQKPQELGLVNATSHICLGSALTVFRSSDSRYFAQLLDAIRLRRIIAITVPNTLVPLPRKARR